MVPSVLFIISSHCYLGVGLARVGVGIGADGRVQLNVSEGGGEEEGFITRMHMFVLKLAPCQPLERTNDATSILTRMKIFVLR